MDVNRHLFSENFQSMKQGSKLVQNKMRSFNNVPLALNSMPLVSNNKNQLLEKLKRYKHESQINNQMSNQTTNQITNPTNTNYTNLIQLKNSTHQYNDTFEHKDRKQYQQLKFINHIEQKVQQTLSKTTSKNYNYNHNYNSKQTAVKTENESKRKYSYKETHRYHNETVRQLNNNLQDMIKDINYQKVNNEFIATIKSNSFQEVKELIRHELIDPTYKDRNNLTALYYSVLGGQFQIVSHILNYFQSKHINHIKQIVNFLDSKCQNLLMLAIRKNQYQIFKILVEYGCNVNHQDETGQSVLHMSVMFKNHQIMDYLIKSGQINKDITNHQNQKTINRTNSNYINDKSNNTYCLQQFETIGSIGKGTFGDVYLVQHKETKTKYALKQLNKKEVIKNDLTKYIVREKNLLTQIDFSFIVKLYGAFQDDSYLYMLLEYCPGQDLRKYLLKERKFNEDKARFYSACILISLQYLHNLNIIYRDLKPENIVIDKEGFPKLTDFGLSKDGVSESTEGTTTLLGSIQYIAPEVLKRKGYGKAVDWFLFGILLFEMLVGRTPFNNLNQYSSYDQFKYQKVNFPDDLSMNAKQLISQVNCEYCLFND